MEGWSDREVNAGGEGKAAEKGSVKNMAIAMHPLENHLVIE